MSHALSYMAIGTWLIAPAAAELPAAAQQRHEEALAAMDRGELARADTLVEAAYAEVDRSPEDALTYRAGRDLLLGTRRVVLRRLAAATDEHRPLCRLREFLDAHRRALVRALGERARAEDTRGIELRIHEVDEALGERALGGESAECAPDPPPAVSPAPAQTAEVSAPRQATVPIPRAATSAGDLERAVRLRRAGAVVLASSAVPLGLMVYALVRVERDARLIRELDAEIEGLGRTASAAESAQAERWYRDGVAFRATAIATGLVGAVMMYSGIGLLARARRLRGPRVAWGPSTIGVSWSGSF